MSRHSHVPEVSVFVAGTPPVMCLSTLLIGRYYKTRLECCVCYVKQATKAKQVARDCLMPFGQVTALCVLTESAFMRC